MNLKDWRHEREQSCAELARALGIGGVNPGGTLARIELGARQPGADMIERIIRHTDGQVSAADMHATRIEWLKANRPEKFDNGDACAVRAGEAATAPVSSTAVLSGEASP